MTGFEPAVGLLQTPLQSFAESNLVTVNHKPLGHIVPNIALVTYQAPMCDAQFPGTQCSHSVLELMTSTVNSRDVTSQTSLSRAVYKSRIGSERFQCAK